jgi:hypothetical protein
MTSAESSATRPLRVAGLVLLGVAAISLVIGLFSIFGGNGDDNGDGDQADGDRPPTSTSAPAGSAPADSSTAPGQSTSRPPASSGAPTSPGTTSQPGTVVPTPPGGDGNGEPGKTQRVRVYNNSTVAGLAQRAADELREAGWPVVGVANYPSGTIPTTTVYYRPGTAEQSAAELLADEFGMRVEPRFEGLREFEPGLVVIVTSDYQGPGGEREPTEKNDK